MAKLTKGLIRKYGITKKAWAIAKGKPRTNRKGSVKPFRANPHKYRIKKGGSTMKGRSKTLFLGLRENELVGGIGYAVAEPFIDQFTSGIGANLPIIGNIGDDVIKLGIGLIGRKYAGKGAMRGVMNAMIAVNMYKVAKTYVPNLTGALAGTTTGTGQGLDGF